MRGGLKEGADGSSAIFTPQGEVIAQSTSQPLHLGALMPAVRRILDKFPPDRMAEGDVFCLNDTDSDPIAALERRASAAGLSTASLDEVLCITAI